MKLSRKSVERLLKLAEDRVSVHVVDPGEIAIQREDRGLLRRARAALLPAERKAGKGKSRAKGKRVELWFVHFLRNWFPAVARNIDQARTGVNKKDFAGTGILHIQAKGVESLNVHAALEQATRDAEAAGQNEIPIVLFKRNNEEPRVAIRADYFFEIFRRSDVCDLSPEEWSTFFWSTFLSHLQVYDPTMDVGPTIEEKK